MTTFAYPLSWPDDCPRTPDHAISHSRFKTLLPEAIDGLMAEINIAWQEAKEALNG